MGCCKSCDNGGPCEGCGGACGGKCDGRCGKVPHDRDHMGEGPGPYQFYTSAQMHDSIYNSVMGGMADEIKKNTSLWRDGDLLFVKYVNPARKGSIVVSVPFAPIMMFCQNLSMMYGKPGTRPSTVMGYAPILSLVTSQLASKKIVDDSGKKQPDASDLGPMDLSSLLKMLPGLTSMVGVYYDDEDDNEGLSEIATLLIGEEVDLGEEADMGISCGPTSPIRNTPVCHRYHGMRGEAVELGDETYLAGDETYLAGDETYLAGCGCGTGVGGGCGCGVPCDGIQPNSPYMSEYHVTKRNSAFIPRRVQRVNYDWSNVPRVDTSAENHFGEASHMYASAAPVNVSGYHYGHYDDEEQVPCAKGGTCGKSCCGSH